MSYTNTFSSILTAGSTSRGTAMSIKNMGRLRRARSASRTIAGSMMGCGALVELSTISACTKYSGNSSQRRALAWSACASFSAHCGERLATKRRVTP